MNWGGGSTPNPDNSNPGEVSIIMWL